MAMLDTKKVEVGTIVADYPDGDEYSIRAISPGYFEDGSPGYMLLEIPTYDHSEPFYVRADELANHYYVAE